MESILLSKGIQISTDAILLALENDIDMLILDDYGKPQGRVWNHRFGSIASLRRQLLKFSDSMAGRKWARSVIVSSLAGMLENLRYLGCLTAPEKESIEECLQQITHAQQRIQHAPLIRWNTAFKSSLRGWEGSAARAYYTCISQNLPSTYTFKNRNRRPSKDTFNSALNYLFGILYGKVELALIKAGLDPFIGIFHTDMYNRPVLVYDVIELYRDWAERLLIDLCMENALKKKQFTVESASIKLNALGTRLIIGRMHGYLDEVISPNAKNRAREQHIQQDCTEFAQHIGSSNGLRQS